jgi:carboxy-cis,cis-muconate cyclase
MAISVLKDGNLANITQTWKYGNNSAIHGLALGPNSDHLYSADYGGDAVWTHQIHRNGKAIVSCRTLALTNGSHPRHLAVHPNGTYLYVLMETTNILTTYSLDLDTGCPTDETITYSLIPEGELEFKFHKTSLTYNRVRCQVLLVCRSDAFYE